LVLFLTHRWHSHQAAFIGLTALASSSAPRRIQDTNASLSPCRLVILLNATRNRLLSDFFGLNYLIQNTVPCFSGKHGDISYWKLQGIGNAIRKEEFRCLSFRIVGPHPPRFTSPDIDWKGLYRGGNDLR